MRARAVTLRPFPVTDGELPAGISSCCSVAERLRLKFLIETLVKAKVLAEDDEELDQLTKAEASKLISELFAK